MASAFARRLAASKHGVLWSVGVGLAGGLYSAPQLALADKKDKDPGRPMFDPEALERGAAALREINKSPYAKNVSLCSHDPAECSLCMHTSPGSHLVCCGIVWLCMHVGVHATCRLNTQ